MKKLLLLFVLCSILLTGCVVDKVDVVEISNEKGMASVKSVTRQTDRMPENIALYENKLLYSMSNYGIEIFYTLDFQTGTIEMLGETDIRGKEIWGAALVDSTFYFYAEETDPNTNSRLNVLYGCDLVDSALLRISQNKNGKSRIPLISFENKLYALQGSEKYESFTNTQKVGLQQTFISMEYDHYLQLIDIAGNTTAISLLQDDVGIPNIKEAAEGRHQVLCVDSDGENIIALEGIETKGTTKYYITKYASDYNCVFVLDISSIFKDYAITNRIWTFQAFGDYFLLSDYYGTSILCRCKDHEIEMIFCESNIEYVDNYCNNGEFEHFYVPETNDIYRLDLHTGTLEIQDYDLENEKYVIRNMFAYDDKLLISKYRGEKHAGEGENEEVLYLISVEDLLPGITPADNPGDLTSLTFSAILPFSLGADGAFIKTEWINANPWTEDAELSTLPVFGRSFTYTEDYPMPKVHEEVAEALMVHAASSLGQDASQLEIRNGISSLAANTENMNISVDYTLSTSISLKKPVSLPDKYDISSDASYEDKQKAAKYIRKKYKKLIEMSKPVINITDEYSSSDLTISFYEGKGTLEEQIINYNFNRIVFYGNDKGELHFIRRNQPDLSYKIGDYPLISVEEAKALLGAGNYYDILGARPTPFDIHPEGDFPGLDSVKMVELVYLSTTNYNIFIPFYCFYAGDLYYVPAIEPQYIVNMPINGYFPEVE